MKVGIQNRRHGHHARVPLSKFMAKCRFPCLRRYADSDSGSDIQQENLLEHNDSMLLGNGWDTRDDAEISPRQPITGQRWETESDEEDQENIEHPHRPLTNVPSAGGQLQQRSMTTAPSGGQLQQQSLATMPSCGQQPFLQTRSSFRPLQPLQSLQSLSMLSDRGNDAASNNLGDNFFPMPKLNSRMWQDGFGRFRKHTIPRRDHTDDGESPSTCRSNHGDNNGFLPQDHGGSWFFQPSSSGRSPDRDFRDVDSLKSSSSEGSDSSEGSCSSANEMNCYLDTCRLIESRTPSAGAGTRQIWEAFSDSVDSHMVAPQTERPGSEDIYMEPADTVAPGTVRGDMNNAQRDMNNARGDMNNTWGEMNNAQGDMNNARGDMNNARGDMNNAQGEMNNARGDMNNARGEMNNARGDINNARGDMNNAQRDMNIACDSSQTESQNPGDRNVSDSQGQGHPSLFDILDRLHQHLQESESHDQDRSTSTPSSLSSTSNQGIIQRLFQTLTHHNLTPEGSVAVRAGSSSTQSTVSSNQDDQGNWYFYDPRLAPQDRLTHRITLRSAPCGGTVSADLISPPSYEEAQAQPIRDAPLLTLLGFVPSDPPPPYPGSDMTPPPPYESPSPDTNSLISDSSSNNTRTDDSDSRISDSSLRTPRDVVESQPETTNQSQSHNIPQQVSFRLNAAMITNSVLPPDMPLPSTCADEANCDSVSADNSFNHNRSGSFNFALVGRPPVRWNRGMGLERWASSHNWASEVVQ